MGELREELDTERIRRERAESTLREGMDEERRRREAAERERDDLRRELFARREPRESPETAGEEPERAESHTPLLEGLRKAQGGPGGVGCSATDGRYRRHPDNCCRGPRSGRAGSVRHWLGPESTPALRGKAYRSDRGTVQAFVSSTRRLFSVVAA
jgi:hypothetical protein